MRAVPRLTRTNDLPAAGIVHFGPGAFFRAFIAPYTDEAMAASGGNWGITAVSLKAGPHSISLFRKDASIPLSNAAQTVTGPARSAPSVT